MKLTSAIILDNGSDCHIPLPIDHCAILQGVQSLPAHHKAQKFIRQVEICLPFYQNLFMRILHDLIVCVEVILAEGYIHI